MPSPRIRADAEGNLLFTFLERDAADEVRALIARSVLADGTVGPERVIAGTADPDDERRFIGTGTVLTGAGRALAGFSVGRTFIPAGPPPCEAHAGIFVAPVTLGGERTLLLRDGRFRVEVSWQDPFNGGSGIGHAVPGTEDAGSFWFFNEDNKEIEIKILDGRTVNGSFWVFAAGLSNVGYRIHVTDQRTG